MAHRAMLTERQRATLFELATEPEALEQHYILDDSDLAHIAERRREENKIGFALQLCAFRYPGRLLTSSEIIPMEVLNFIGEQIGVESDALIRYAKRRQTRQQHLETLRKLYGYQVCSGSIAKELKAWLVDQGIEARSNENLVQRFVDRCRQLNVILPATKVIERLCADSLVEAERRIDRLITCRLSLDNKASLDALLAEKVDSKLSSFVWLRQFEIGHNSADANRLMDRLEKLQSLAVPASIVEGLPAHQIQRWRRHGERYFADDLRDLSEDRRYAIMAICVVEWQARIADALVETHDRIVGKVWNEAKKVCDTRIENAQTSVQTALATFQDLGTALLRAHEEDEPLEDAVETSAGWFKLQRMMFEVQSLSTTMAADPIPHMVSGYHTFKLYAPRMMRVLDIEGASVSKSLLAAIKAIAQGQAFDDEARKFLRGRSKWHGHLRDADDKFWQVAALYHVSKAFRAADIWLKHSKNYADQKRDLLPASAIKNYEHISLPFNPSTWIAEKKQQMKEALAQLSKAAKAGALPHASIIDGQLKTTRLKAAVPEGAAALLTDLYNRLPDVRITDMLQEVEATIGFSEAFTNFRTGAVCSDKIGLLTVLLSEGLNLGLSKMAEASNTHSYRQLSRIARWHIESGAINNALAMVIDAHSNLPMAQVWGLGDTASSDGQFFATTRQGEAMNLINAKYGNLPGIKAYSHVSNQFAPFSTQNIPATVSEAPYILDGLLLTDAGKKVKEQYADTGGFTDMLMACTALLGFNLVLRIKDLPSKRLYIFDPGKAPANLKGLIGGKIKEQLIADNWQDILSVVATMASGHTPPSLMLRKFAAYPRQSDLALALREIGRIERTLFIIRWLLDGDLQRRTQIGLNKGEAHHALKNALRIGRQGEIRDRTSESQNYRMAGLNLLAAIAIYWNTKHLGFAVVKRRKAGLETPDDLLSHISPLGWAHILLTGEYRWRKHS